MRDMLFRGLSTEWATRHVVCSTVIVATTMLLGGASARAQELFRDPQFAVQVTQGIVYGTGSVTNPAPGEIDLLLDLYQPTGPNVPDLRPGFITSHGGGFAGGSRQEANHVLLATEMAARGYVAVSLDYRLSGNGPVVSSEFAQLATDLAGEFAPISTDDVTAAVEDAVTALRWFVANANSLQLDTSRIAMGGSSAGAVMALETAYVLDDHGITNVPAIGAVMDLWGALGPIGIDDMEAGEPPLIIIHGEDDTTIPFAVAEALVAHAQSESIPFEFLPIPGANHGFANLTSEFFVDEIAPGVTRFDRVVEFLYFHLFSSVTTPVPGSGAGSIALLVLLLASVGCWTLRRRLVS